MPRTAKNPETYINRNGMITRTVTTSTVKIEFVRLDKKQFDEIEITVRKPGNSAVIEAKRQFKDMMKGENVQITKAETVKTVNSLRGMTEEHFIEESVELKPAQMTIKELETMTKLDNETEEQ